MEPPALCSKKLVYLCIPAKQLGAVHILIGSVHSSWQFKCKRKFLCIGRQTRQALDAPLACWCAGLCEWGDKSRANSAWVSLTETRYSSLLSRAQQISLAPNRKKFKVTQLWDLLSNHKINPILWQQCNIFTQFRGPGLPYSIGRYFF